LSTLTLEELFNNRVKEILERKQILLDFALNLPETNKTKQKYITTVNQIEPPKLIAIDGRLAEIEIYGEIRKINRWHVSIMPLTICKKKVATISNLSALMSGAKQKAVASCAKSRRMPDGTYKGIDSMMKTRIDRGINGLIAQKVALARRMPDGTYKGHQATLKTKRDNGIHEIAAKKTALSRRMPDGTYSGSHKTATTRRQRGYGHHHFGKFCLYHSNAGKWIVMRSTWEWLYAKYLDDNGFVWEYEPHQLPVGEKKHLPDFLIEGVGYLEIKPTHFIYDRLEKEYIEKYNVTIVTEKDFNFKKDAHIVKGYILCPR
jgi:hypothetical protein